MSDNKLVDKVKAEFAEKDAQPVPTQPQTSKGNCPDCNGDGIKSPTDTHVCATCEGRGSIN